MEANANELNLVLSASQTHNLANMRMTKAQSFAGLPKLWNSYRVKHSLMELLRQRLAVHLREKSVKRSVQPG